MGEEGVKNDSQVSRWVNWVQYVKPHTEIGHRERGEVSWWNDEFSSGHTATRCLWDTEIEMLSRYSDVRKKFAT